MGTDAVGFLKLCKRERPAAIRTRTKISAFYHSSIIQYTVGLLIVLNFVMVIGNAQFNPKDEDNEFKGVLEILEYGPSSPSEQLDYWRTRTLTVCLKVNLCSFAKPPMLFMFNKNCCCSKVQRHCSATHLLYKGEVFERICMAPCLQGSLSTAHCVHLCGAQIRI